MSLVSFRKCLLYLLVLMPANFIYSQNLCDSLKNEISVYLTSYTQKKLAIGTIKIDSATVVRKKKQIDLYANINCSYIPFREENVADIYGNIHRILSPEYEKFNIRLITDKHPVEELITGQKRKKTFTNRLEKPLVTPVDRPYKIDRGLEDRHIALWQSHGLYYEQKLARWEWQRARLFQTVEDLYTQAYVLPYLVPMLENAGANVLLPRERDIQYQEVIVDNDRNTGTSSYREKHGKEQWMQGSGAGFAHLKEEYVDYENPFKDGTFRQIETIKKGEESVAEWTPEIPESGRYAVYVSYQTVDNSTEDALYIISHAGGETSFRVNQTMGGGTWIYLGHFDFKAGLNETGKVRLSNLSVRSNRIVTADAVKIGGGYGNIARKVNDQLILTENIKSSENAGEQQAKTKFPVTSVSETSGSPRFTEAARYWLQWAGFPDSIYSKNKGVNDYMDDYQSRGRWVNYIAGGSTANPKTPGLHIPVDLAFAFHTDAGTTPDDSIIGTLGIFSTRANDGIFLNNKASRYLSRDLSDLIQTQIVEDVRRLYEPAWSRRGLWNRTYSEAETPQVPTMLLEFLSHQNLADMRYGLDPRFRFDVSRAIYKGMLKFISQQYKQEYIVQPLPPDGFGIRFISENEVELFWQAVPDTLEPTAHPEKFVVYTRTGNGGFDNGMSVTGNSCRFAQQSGVQYSYKVTAVNRGGESFSSEILSACRMPSERGLVLIVNGFYRVSAPDCFVSSDGLAGFTDRMDHGVPDKYDISYTGSQHEFRRSIPWTDDDSPGFGASDANYEGRVIAGNTFDYPSVHGEAIAAAGYSYVSCSAKAVMEGMVDLNAYKLVDWILGKQKQTLIGRGIHAPLFKTFPAALQTSITGYCHNGGNIFISGAFVGSDLAHTPEDILFATDILKYKWRTGCAAVTGKIKTVPSPFPLSAGTYTYYHEPNEQSYVVESPDAIEPVGPDAATIFRYPENNLSAGIAFSGNYRTCVLGFPFEAVKGKEERAKMMAGILQALTEN